MQILLVQDRAEVREKFGFFLESTYGAKVHESTNLPDAIQTVKNSNPPVDLIILDSKEGKIEDLQTFWSVTQSIPMMVCAQRSPEGATERENVVGVIDRAAFMEGVLGAIDSLIDKGLLKERKSEEGQVRIRTKLLLSVCPLKGDIYIRLNQTKFVRLFREGDIFDLADLEKYTIKKGVEYLYIRQAQCAEFAEKYREELKKLLKSDVITVEEVSKLGESVHETIQELTHQIGFTKEVQELTKTHVQLTVKSMGKDPQLLDLLNKLRASEGQYISTHSTLCAYVACAIAAQLQWGSDTTFYKLTLAAFLHDVTLNNHDLAALGTLEELKKEGKKFTDAEVEAFKNHPAESADMIKKMTEVPPDVDTIVRQHHERPDGTGFPRHMTHAYIAPLATVFIVSHDLTQHILAGGANFDIGQFLSGYRDRYKSSQFKKVVACIETLQQIKNLKTAMKEGTE